jgi:hypothetical protein
LVNILRSSGAVADFARALFEAEGLPLGRHDDRLSGRGWFPLDTNLRVLAGIGRQFGDRAIFEIGFSVRDHATFPPAIVDVRRALASLDVAFHMNHRRDGLVMFDPGTGQMLEGIGHYSCRSSTGRALVSESSTVYPCDFDLGVISGIASRFDAGARVRHPADAPCRRRDAAACVYAVSW